MRTFDYERIKGEKWDSDILRSVAGIERSTGRQELYLQQHPEDVERLVTIGKIQSTEASNAIEGIVTTDTRIRQLVEDKTAPRNRSEREIVGYRNALNLIHESFDSIPIAPNYILQLHRTLLMPSGTTAGRLKNVQNCIAARHPDGRTETLFTPLSPLETPEALERICASYSRVIEEGTVEPLLVIPAFVHDFLCIHPFSDGNGRMSRLLTTLMLYRNRYYVGRYNSLEAKINNTKDAYYDALARSQTGWHEGTEDATPFTRYLLGTVLSACQDFEARFELVQIKRSALEIVRGATLFKMGQLTKQDICELCPSLGMSTIEGALRKLVAAGEVSRVGSGRATRYYRPKQRWKHEARRVRRTRLVTRGATTHLSKPCLFSVDGMQALSRWQVPSPLMRSS